MKHSLRLALCALFLVSTSGLRAEAPATAAAPAKAAPAKTAARPAGQADPRAEDPSLVLDLPDVVPAKPAPKTAPPQKPKPAQVVQKSIQPAANSLSPSKTIRFDKPIDPNLQLPIATEVAVILANNKFFPSKVKLREGLPTKFFFTTVNKKPGALVIERAQVQRWIAKERPAGESEADRARWESSHEINASRITEVIFSEPKAGMYNFHDALTGATGEITVEQ